MKTILDVLNDEVGEYGLDALGTLTNKRIAKILETIGYKLEKNVLGEEYLSDEAMMTAIMLKYLENAAKKFDINGFRKIWMNTKDGKYAGIDIIFEDILEPANYHRGLSKVISLLESDYGRTKFEKAIQNVRNILIKLERDEELEIFENRIMPVLPLYVETAKDFEKQQDKFTKTLLDKISTNSKR